MIRRGILSIIVFALVFFKATAQLCQGSLGDPIVNITFGSGNNPGPPLSAATTNYQYLTTDCPNDGQYAVRNRTDNCYNNWHTLNADHTGDAGGYFMLVNASFQPSAFYVDTVDLYCSNTIYEFAAWAINMMRNPTCAGNPTIPPNLTFNIERTDGTVIQSYNTGDIPLLPSITWNQYGFFFTAPPGVNRVVLRIINNAPGGCGNDIAIDDITFRPCGPQVDVAINAGGNEWNICKGSTALLELTSQVSSGFQNPQLQWQVSNDNGGTWQDVPSANNPTLQVPITETTAPGTYLYRMSVAELENASILLCRVNSAPLRVNVYALPTITKNTNSPICENSELQLQADGGTGYAWLGPNSFSSTSGSVVFQNAQVGMSGKYYVTVTDDNNCSTTDSLLVEVHPRPAATANPEASTICEGESVPLMASGGTEFSWLPAEGLSSANIATPVSAPGDSIEYMVIVSNDFGCSDTAYTDVNVVRLPRANAGPDREMFEGESVFLDGSVEGTSVNYLWSPDYSISDVNVEDPEVNPMIDTTYILTVISEAGCGVSADTVHVRVYKGIFIPTAFTPNNDGLNDTWRIPGLGIINEHQVRVFNRYGQIVFSTKSNQPWDGNLGGKPQPAGVYPYLITMKGKLFRKGFITIIR